MDSEQVNFELLQDVMTELQDHLPLLEDDLHQLVRFPESVELVASAFRHMHSIKGDFSYCQATPIAEFVHRLENVMQSLRERRYLSSALISEAILQSMDRVRDMAMVLRSTRRFDETPLTGLLASIDELAEAGSQAAADQAARHILLAAHSPGELLQTVSRWAPAGAEATPAAAAAVNSDAALRLGQQLASALGARHPPWHDRAARQLAMVLELNRHHSQKVAEAPLTLAVYWHDVGLLALPDALLANPPRAKDPQWPDWCQHPERAAQWLLTVDPGCEEAAQIIRQHHQWSDRRGFPARLGSEPLHPGAQMVACVDLFQDSVAGLCGEEYRRAALRAVFDIHGDLDTRFDAFLINAFQAVSRDWSQHAAT
ncbi:hypothetical protein FNU76_22405 [Chitinimonas arctica]|uniref:HD domain-containing protein n=1 Tax=Chitinimonas arctica TaxID=2594795 RepID=A0A516SL43_9NEIS|nr:HD domain-containing phosphohydrolase [Chitinimonas arctica]QDQ28881.1 hypothetical protein FNU76_22405 [Chitinimonas arctica]